MARLCSLDGCDRVHHSKGYCRKHYLRVVKHGSPKPRPGGPSPIEVRFWRHVEKRGPDECWPWTAKRQRQGYGRIGIGRNKQLGAHRVSFELANGFLPEVVMHSCDHPWCVNPAHLRPGTIAENMADMRAKGRGYEFQRPRGEEHHRAKLTEDMVRQIKARPNDKPTALAREFGVKYSVVHRIRAGMAWRHVE